SEEAFMKGIRKKQSKGEYLFLIRDAKEEKCEEWKIPEGMKDEIDFLFENNKVQHKGIRDVVKKHRNVFLQDLPPGKPPVRKGHVFEVELEPNVEPIKRPIYKMSPAELEEAKKQTDYMLEHGLVQPSKSPWGSPVLFAPKKDGGLRFCIDYRWINSRTVKNRYPLPLPEELVDRLSGAKVYTKLDLRSGYWQMPIRDEDIPKTAFRTRYGHYECLVLPFGLTNAPAQFMNMVNDILEEYLDKFVVVFLDDILIYSSSLEEHQEHLDVVLDKLRQYSLFAKAKKCEIATAETEYLGLWITSDGVEPLKPKIKAIEEWKTPENVHDVRSFLGMVSYYRKFIPGFAHIAGPLHNLVKKTVTWQWGPHERKAFRELKEKMTRAPILRIPDPTLEYTVITDALLSAYGAVLLQDQGKGLQPLAFLSRRLKPAESRYSPYEREFGAIAWALAEWRHYLEGAPGGVQVFTDHQPLQTIMKQSHLTRMQARWLKNGYFLSINPTIKYIRGKANVVADALSRSLPGTREKDLQIVPMEELKAITVTSLAPDVLLRWKEATRTDKRLQDLVVTAGKQGYTIDDEGLVWYKQPRTRKPKKLVVPHVLRQEVMQENHDDITAGHLGTTRTIELI
ncbi:MAG: reverse transcriptase domain-containing protein, partial [Bacteroidota bacterium]